MTYDTKVSIIHASIWIGGTTIAILLFRFFVSIRLYAWAIVSTCIPTTAFGLYLIFSKYAF